MKAGQNSRMLRGGNIGQGTCQHAHEMQRAVVKNRRYGPYIKVNAKNIFRPVIAARFKHGPAFALNSSTQAITGS